MFNRLKDAFKNKDLRKRILLTLLLVLLFRLGCWLPNPCFQTGADGLGSAIEGNTFLNLLSSISGGALANASLLALGVSPYISAQIVVQLLTVAIPSLEKLSKEGEEGKQKLDKINKFVALILGSAQAIGIVVAYKEYLNVSLFSLGGNAPIWLVGTLAVIIAVAGSMFTYWLGEKITEYGVSNGLSVLIFVGILSSAGSALLDTLKNIFSANAQDGEVWKLILFLVTLIIIFALIVAMDSAERRIRVQYAKQIKGRKAYGGQSNYIPMKLLGTGVMPIIFANSILTFPQMLFSIFWPKSTFLTWYQKWLGTGSVIYCIIVGLLILFFAYFYAQMTFKPDDISKQIQQNGGFITGLRPGRPTTDHLAKIQKRIVLFGAIFLAFVTIVPSIVFGAIGSTGDLINAFTATGMLIIVSVALEIDKQLEAQLMIKSYKGFLK